MREKTGTSLSKRISLIILIMVVSSTAIVGIFSYYLYRRDCVNVGADKACSIAQTIASAIDPVQFEEIIAAGAENQYWYDTKQFVDNVKTRTGVMYLYILDKDYHQNVTYFMEGTTPDEADSLGLGDKESADAHADELFEALNTGLSTTTDIYDSEGYGKMVSGFAPILNGRQAVIGVVGVDIGMDEVMRSSYAFGAMVVICVVVFSAVFWFISRAFVKRHIGTPVGALSAASVQLAAGDMEIDLSVHSNDEIGRLTASFRDMVDSTKKQIAVLEHLANGDLRADITPRCDRDTMSFAIKKTIDNLNDMFREINDSTAHVTTGAGQIADASQTLAQGAAEQSATVGQLESAVVQVADKTKESAAMAGKAAVLADTIKDSAEKGSHQMDRMTQAVKEINEASQSIGRVIKTIDDIAFQTNILALNAAVEAARAGQHGKGFAVVADEVRNLAVKSAEAAKDTESLIANSIEKAELGARIADETAASLTEIVAGINQSSRIMGEIASFSEEQSAAIGMINSNIIQVARVIQQNSATAEESAAASEELSGQSAVLQGLVAKFKLKDTASRPLSRSASASARGTGFSLAASGNGSEKY